MLFSFCRHTSADSFEVRRVEDETYLRRVEAKVDPEVEKLDLYSLSTKYMRSCIDIKVYGPFIYFTLSHPCKTATAEPKGVKERSVYISTANNI